MKEHIHQRGKTWTFVIDVGKDDLGRRKQVSRGGFDSEGAARAAARKMLVKVEEDGRYLEPSKQRLGPFMERWLASVRPSLRPSSYAVHRNLAHAHIVPRLGAVELRRLTPAQLNAFYGDLLSNGRRDGKGGLAPITVFRVHSTIRQALADAVRWGDLPRNVADLATHPRGKSEARMRVWSPSEVARFLEFVAGDRLTAAYLLLATTGMRRGEVLGLRWKDVDLQKSRLSVAQTVVTVDYQVQFSAPKTAAGRRSIALDAHTVEGLKEHRRRQLAERNQLGTPWPSGDDLVFSTVAGEPLHPNGFSDRFDRLVKNAQLPRITVHDLRHTHATIALQAGISPKVVSERLGHTTVSMTLDTYSHVIPAMQEDAAARVAALMFGTR